jgi:hypothetical protein
VKASEVPQDFASKSQLECKRPSLEKRALSSPCFLNVCRTYATFLTNEPTEKPNSHTKARIHTQKPEFTHKSSIVALSGAFCVDMKPNVPWYHVILRVGGVLAYLFVPFPRRNLNSTLESQTKH